MTQILDVAESPIQELSVKKEGKFLDTNFKKTILVKPKDYDEDQIKEEIVWNTRMSFAEYLASEESNYRKEFTVGIIPEFYFAKEREKKVLPENTYPEEVCLNRLGANVKKLSLFEFVQFSMIAKTWSKKFLHSSVYIPIGTVDQREIRPICIIGGWIDNFTGDQKDSLQGSKIPSITFWLEKKFFLVKIV